MNENIKRDDTFTDNGSAKFGQRFTIKKLIKFVYPSVIMMLCSSIYGVVDGLFVSNFAGKQAFASVNLIMPVLMAFSSLGFMIGTGGSALVAKILGEGDVKKANGIFSFLVYITIVLGLIATTLGIIFMPQLTDLMCKMQPEAESLKEYCILYGRINMGGMTLFMLQCAFQSLIPAAGKHKLGLILTVSAGVTNAVLDAVFIAGFKMGVAGAGIATISGQAVASIAPIIYFTVNKKCVLRLGKPQLNFKALLKTCANGASETMTNLSLSLVNILYNYQLMRLIGDSGVSAYGVLMYVGYVFISFFLGYAVGVSPIISFNLGAKNMDEVKNLLRKSLIIIAVSSAVMFGLSMGLSSPLSYVFVGYDKALFELTKRAFFIYSFMFLLSGFNIFGSAFFTALNNGVVSAIISFFRTLVMQVLCVMLLPLILKLDGVWASNVVAEAVSVVITFTFILCFKKKYGY